MLPLVNRQFAEIFVQHKVGNLLDRISFLQDRVDLLEFKLYMAELPSIMECARALNMDQIHCACHECCASGFVDHGTPASPMECILLPAFLRIVTEVCKEFPVDENGHTKVTLFVHMANMHCR